MLNVLWNRHTGDYNFMYFMKYEDLVILVVTECKILMSTKTNHYYYGSLNMNLEWKTLIKCITCLKNDKDFIGKHCQIKNNSSRGKQHLICTKWLHI